MIRVNITLQCDEKKALWLLSQQERRNPRAQAALLIRQQLEQLGLLPAIRPQKQESVSGSQPG